MFIFWMSWWDIGGLIFNWIWFFIECVDYRIFFVWIEVGWFVEDVIDIEFVVLRMKVKFFG